MGRGDPSRPIEDANWKWDAKRVDVLEDLLYGGDQGSQFIGR